MNRSKASTRWAIEAVLAVCVVIVWAYDIHLISYNRTPPALDIPVELRDFTIRADAFPWQAASLPRIAWNPFPLEPEPILQTESGQQELPSLILQGLYNDGIKKAALLKEVASGETRMMFEGDEWNGTTLHVVGVDWVNLINGDKSWKITLPSTTGLGR